MDENMQSSNKVGAIIATLVVVILLVAGVYSVVNWKKNQAEDDKPVAGSDYYVSVIDVKHQYRDGKHVYAGSLDLPTPCYSLDSSIGKDTETSATIKLDTMRSEEEMCAQVISTKKFKLETSGSGTLSVKGLLNGKPLQLNIFEVPMNQNIDDVDIDTKG